MLDKVFYYALTFAEAGLSVFGIRDTYEQPPYTVRQEIAEAVQIRDYAPRVAVETSVESADSKAASSEAFGRLFAYITGANTGGTMVSMTAPVEMRGGEGKMIAMTAPVQTDATGKATTMRFFLPRDLAANPPQPSDARVRIVSLPAATVATLRFSGTLDETTRASRTSELLNTLTGTAWKPAENSPSLAHTCRPPRSTTWSCA